METKTNEIKTIDVITIEDKYKTDYKKKFWKDRYNNCISDEDKEIINKLFGHNQTLWKKAHQQGFVHGSVKRIPIDSKFENEKPGYVGRFSGDLIAADRLEIIINEWKPVLYFRNVTERIDTNGFW